MKSRFVFALSLLCAIPAHSMPWSTLSEREIRKIIMHTGKLNSAEADSIIAAMKNTTSSRKLEVSGVLYAHRWNFGVCLDTDYVDFSVAFKDSVTHELMKIPNMITARL